MRKDKTNVVLIGMMGCGKTTIAKLLKDKLHKQWIDMDQYIENLKKMKKENPERAREKARESLVESGVFNSDGTPKKNICD